MSKPAHVVVNGKRVFNKTVETDLHFMLAQAAQDDDPALVYHARIDIVLPVPGDSAAHSSRPGLDAAVIMMSRSLRSGCCSHIAIDRLRSCGVATQRTGDECSSPPPISREYL